MEQYQISVEGMTCGGCEQRVTEATKQVEGVYEVDADHETDSVDVTAESGVEDDVEQAIHDAGYDVTA